MTISVFSPIDIGPYPFTTDLTLMWDWGGASVFHFVASSTQYVHSLFNSEHCICSSSFHHKSCDACLRLHANPGTQPQQWYWVAISVLQNGNLNTFGDIATSTL